MAGWVESIAESKIVDRILAVLLICLLALPFITVALLIAHEL
jgi:hypothetical protein